MPLNLRAPNPVDKYAIEWLSLAQELLRVFHGDAGARRAARYLLALARDTRCRGPLSALPWHLEVLQAHQLDPGALAALGIMHVPITLAEMWPAARLRISSRRVATLA